MACQFGIAKVEIEINAKWKNGKLIACFNLFSDSSDTVIFENENSLYQTIKIENGSEASNGIDRTEEARNRGITTAENALVNGPMDDRKYSSTKYEVRIIVQNSKKYNSISLSKKGE